MPCRLLRSLLLLLSYVRLYVQASPVLCRDVEARLRVDDNIVRTLTIKHDQVAPVAVRRRAHDLLRMSESTVSGVMDHNPMVEYYAARALLMLGLVSRDELLSLPRFRPDAAWDSLRQNELLTRAAAGEEEATQHLQIAVPTHKQEGAMRRREAHEEERRMNAYEVHRRAANIRVAGERAQYLVDEAQRAQQRMEQYYRQGQAMRDAKVAKKRNGERKPRGADAVAAVLAKPLPPKFKQKLSWARYVRGGKVRAQPGWVNDTPADSSSSTAASSTPAATASSSSSAQSTASA